MFSIQSLPQRISDKIMPEPMSGCWLWIGARNSHGYGHIKKTDGEYLAHRLIYKLLKAPFKKNAVFDHLCRNRACVNPAHLEPVTHRINLLRGNTVTAMHAAKSGCPEGHPYDMIDSDGARRCRKCLNAAARERTYRRRHQYDARAH